jgi:hypothetical protein
MHSGSRKRANGNANGKPKRRFERRRFQIQVEIEIVPHGRHGPNPLNPFCSMPQHDRHRLLIEALADIWARHCREVNGAS